MDDSYSRFARFYDPVIGRFNSKLRSIGMRMLHELSPAVRIAVVGEMRRVVKQDGRILITDYNPGPGKPLRGWMTKITIAVAETIAGGEHFRNYRQFMANGGLYTLLDEHRLTIVEQKIVGGGTIGLYILDISQADQ